MAVWKKVIVSGSNISQLNNDALYVTSSASGGGLTGSFTGSFYGDGSGLSGVTTDITALNSHTASVNTFTGSIDGEVTVLMGATGSQYAHIANLNTWTGSASRKSEISGSFTAASSSLSSRVTDLENFSASLDATFATEAELNAATSSLSASLAIDIINNELTINALDGEVTNLMASTGSNYSHITNLLSWTGSASRKSEISGSFTLLSASIAADIAGVSAGALETGSFAVTLDPVTGSIGFTEGLEIGDVYDLGSGTTDIRVPNGASWLELNYADTDFIWLDGTDAGITLDNNHEWRFYYDGTFIAPGEIRTSTTVSASVFNVVGGTIVSASAQTIANLAGTNIISGSSQLAVVPNVATTISGSFTSLSSSIESRLVTVEGNVGAGGLLSSSAQIASDISGSFTSTSSSIASDIATNVTDISALQTFSQSFDNAFNLSGQNVTVVGNLTVAGTTTTVDSTTIDIGDNIIALNGTGATKGGLAVNDGPASGSLLWDGTNDYWVAGPTGSEVKILLATGDGVISGSAQIAADISGSITSTSASIAIDIAGNANSLASVAGEIQAVMNSTGSKYSQVNNLMAATGSVYQQVAGLLAETGSQYSHITNLNSFTGSFSSSAASRITDLEVFSSSLDASYVTEAELVAATASLSASLAVDIIANENNIGILEGSIGSLNTFTGSYSSSATLRITNLENFSSSLDNTFASEADLYSATASLSSSLAEDIAANVTNIANLQSFSSSIESTIYSYTGSFAGDGSGLEGITVTQNATVTASFTNATTASITHNFNSDNVIVTVYDQYNQQFLPSTIWTKTEDVVELHFETAETGRAVVARGGHIVSGSIPWDNILEKPDNLLSGSAQLATIPNVATTISGSFTLLDGEVTALMAATGSNYSHISNLLTWTGSAGRKSEISGSFTDLSASIATTISGLSQTLDVSGSDATGGSIDLLTQDLTITGANNEIETTVSGQTVTIGFVTNPTVSGNLTVTGDLTVTGNTIEQQVTNLNVEDQFILLNSGSAAADAGIVVNGQGAAFGWDESENRWALDFEGATWNQTTITSDAYVAAVVTSDDANYQKVGNIRVQGGEIYIYV